MPRKEEVWEKIVSTVVSTVLSPLKVVESVVDIAANTEAVLLPCNN